jgi:hypothetical protein
MMNNTFLAEALEAALRSIASDPYFQGLHSDDARRSFVEMKINLAHAKADHQSRYETVRPHN